MRYNWDRILRLRIARRENLEGQFGCIHIVGICPVKRRINREHKWYSYIVYPPYFDWLSPDRLTHCPRHTSEVSRLASFCIFNEAAKAENCRRPKTCLPSIGVQNRQYLLGKRRS